jgi:hypothetical protein
LLSLEIKGFMILFSENVFPFPFMAYLEMNRARNCKEAGCEKSVLLAF